MKWMRSRAALLAATAMLFVSWAAVFIYTSSFVAIDGERHFCLFDDAMVSMRYALNLVKGNGLVWNQGQYVEGITNLSQTLLMATAIAVFGKWWSVLAIQLIGIPICLAIAFLTMKIGDEILGRKSSQRDMYLVLCFVAGISYYPLTYWVLMGMESGLLAALILGATLVAFRIDGRGTFSMWFPLLLGCAFFTRPDAAIPIALLFLYRFLGLRRVPGGWRALASEAAVVAGFVVCLSVFRLVYYGDFVPNTYTLKMTRMPLGERLINGFGFIVPFLAWAAVPLVLAILGVVVNLKRKTVLCLSLVVSMVLYQIAVGGDPWQYWRMTAPYMPLVFVLALGGVKRLAEKGSPRFVRFERPLLLGVLGLMIVLLNAEFSDELSFRRRPYMVDFNHATVSAAIALNEVADSTATIGVVWAGSLPYFCELKAIDFLGKNDAAIAVLPPDTTGAVSWRGMQSVPGHNKYDLDYSIKELKPTYVQVAIWGKDNLTDYVKKEYVGVWYEGVPLTLKKDAKSIHWDKVQKNPPREPPMLSQELW
jgi:arabinofuranosyltransferase